MSGVFFVVRAILSLLPMVIMGVWLFVVVENERNHVIIFQPMELVKIEDVDVPPSDHPDAITPANLKLDFDETTYDSSKDENYIDVSERSDDF